MQLPEHMRENEDDAASKLWAVYAAVAEKYDKRLVESWRSNMDGMLIFAGLFSASLTAFIIESYKTLVPDSGDATVVLLNQISQQLAATANGSSYHILPPAPFTPPKTSLICNALWFISLGLSLTCALFATLLEQWARDFLHRADMRSAPVTRVRIFSYLYYGMKRFGMHTVVNLIPLLMHTSLFLFFAGLVAFLVPINFSMALVAGGLLAVLTTAYSALTLLSLWHSDCPYRTPITGVFWSLIQGFKTLWRGHFGAPDVPSSPPSLRRDTMVDAISHRAMEILNNRDHRALVWTVKSLADDTELEPFIESIPEVLWGPHRRRYTYNDHIQRLLLNPDLHLLSRIKDLLRSCSTGLLSVEASQRRQISCYKALWALATLQAAVVHPATPIDLSDIGTNYINEIDLEQQHYTTSVAAALKWTGFLVIQIHLQELLHYLTQCEAEAQNRACTRPCYGHGRKNYGVILLRYG
ncbi:hypothetical protein C8R45DRAFT_883937 [Mycena sanguinolenta]|nr:hypothetical protein C8R45DRAFT_883937 [Mycena sanguinolenta]